MTGSLTITAEDATQLGGEGTSLDVEACLVNVSPVDKLHLIRTFFKAVKATRSEVDMAWELFTHPKKDACDILLKQTIIDMMTGSLEPETAKNIAEHMADFMAAMDCELGEDADED